MSCLNTEILVGFFFGLTASVVIAIFAIVKVGMILKVVLNEVKLKVDTDVELKKIFYNKYFSRDTMWEQRVLFLFLTSKKLDKVSTKSKKSVLFYNILILTPITWFGLFYFFFKLNCG